MKNLYKWDNKNLRTQFFNLKNEFNNKNYSKEEFSMQEYYLVAILDMIRINELNLSFIEKYPYRFLSNKNLKKSIKSDVKNYTTRNQRNIIKKNKDYFKENTIDISSIMQKNISFEEQIRLINNNFSKTPELKIAHNTLFNPDNHLLKITRKKGENAFWNVKNNGYISNINDETIIDFNSLCHELGHYDESILTNQAIDKKINAYDMFKLKNYTEIYSIFYELISAIILNNEGYIDDHEMDTLFNYIEDENTYNIQYYLLAMEYLSNNKNAKINLIRALSCSLSDIFMYCYSYLIARKLINQYQNDSEKAFYNLNYLIKNITPYNEKEILKYCDIDLYSFDNDDINIKRSKF